MSQMLHFQFGADIGTLGVEGGNRNPGNRSTESNFRFQHRHKGHMSSWLFRPRHKCHELLAIVRRLQYHRMSIFFEKYGAVFEKNK